MTEKRFKVFTGNNYGVQSVDGEVLIDSIVSIGDADVLVDLLNELNDENEKLKKQLSDCKEKKQQMKEFFMNSEAIIEQKKLQKLIYQRVFNLIDEKIDEFRNGDYGDLHCNTIHMFLDLKQELGDVE